MTKTSYGARRKYALGESLDSVNELPLPQRRAGLPHLPLDARALADFLLGQRLNYPAPLYFSLMNLVLLARRGPRAHRPRHPAGRPQHDARTAGRFIITDAQDERGCAMQRLAAAIQFAIPGVPSVYYGDETGMNGMLDPFDRAPFTVGKRPLVDWYSKLAELRNENDAHLHRGGGLLRAGRGRADRTAFRRRRAGWNSAWRPKTALSSPSSTARPMKKRIVADLWAGHAGLTAAETQSLRASGITRARCLLSGDSAGRLRGPGAAGAAARVGAHLPAHMKTVSALPQPRGRGQLWREIYETVKTLPRRHRHQKSRTRVALRPPLGYTSPRSPRARASAPPAASWTFFRPKARALGAGF